MCLYVCPSDICLCPSVLSVCVSTSLYAHINSRKSLFVYISVAIHIFFHVIFNLSASLRALLLVCEYFCLFLPPSPPNQPIQHSPTHSNIFYVLTYLSVLLQADASQNHLLFGTQTLKM